MHRFLASPIDGNRTAVRAHDGHALGAGFVGQATEVSVHDRRDVSIHDRRGGALVLAEFRDQMARDRDRQPGRLDGACDRLFMVRVRIRVQQRYRDSVSPAREDTTRELAQLGVVERIDQLTSWAEATGDAQSVVPVDERRKSVTYQRVQLRTILTADLDDVFETPVRDEHHLSPPAFEQRVGRDRGSMEEREGVVRRKDACDAVENGLSGIIRRRRYFERLDPTLTEQHQVGECAAGVDRQERR